MKAGDKVANGKGDFAYVRTPLTVDAQGRVLGDIVGKPPASSWAWMHPSVWKVVHRDPEPLLKIRATLKVRGEEASRKYYKLIDEALDAIVSENCACGGGSTSPDRDRCDVDQMPGVMILYPDDEDY